MRPTVLDLFAGCGGFSCGFAHAGCHVVAFVEQWQPAINTFLKNHPEAILLGRDITQMPNGKFLPLQGKIDVIIGGPPCQGFSMCGKRDPKDKRNQLYKEFLRVVKIIQPKTIVIENVRGLLSMKGHKQEKIINNILHDLIELDYFVSYKLLKASDYGVAQNRERLFIIGHRLDLFPQPEGKQKNVLEAIADLPNEETELNGHIFFQTTPETVTKIAKLQQGEKLSATFNFSRQRLHANRPSKTVTTKPTFIHPFYNRFLTPRELARLQGFPDSFEFTGGRTIMTKQIGNAVPPLLGEAIARKIVEVY